MFTLPSSILKVYIEAFVGYSNIHHPDGFNNTRSLKTAPFNMLLLWEQWAEDGVPVLEG